MEIRWLGHSAFEIKTKNKILLLDPALKINPNSSCKPKDIKKADYILISHGHYDHLGDSIELAKKTKAKIIAIVELAVYCQGKGVKDAAMLNICSPMDFQGIKIGLVPAAHSGGIGLEDGKAVYSGNPVGFIIQSEGKTVYFAGDTGLCADLKMIGEVYKPDIAMLPISGSFTMDPKEAAIAASWIKPKVVIPMHYNSLPSLPKVNVNELIKGVKKRSPKTRCIILKPGDMYRC
ncbi:MAG: metal-dependent hydrolase [Nanoarchaeota archaeon]|nr:metal-dependent hydrolase [Nanoarchaeota archaeon]